MRSFVGLVVFFLFPTGLSLPAVAPEKPEPVPIQPSTFTVSSIPAVTIPAFPEQAASSGTCRLDLPGEFFKGIAGACTSSTSSSASHSFSRSRCCPTLAAWLYSAYSATAIAAAVKLQSAAQSSELIPVLPDDSETCMDAAQKALHSHGVALGTVNGSCDVPYCFCGVRLRPLSCPRGFRLESSGDGKWVAGDERARRIEKDCAAATTANGCTRCLHSIYQTKEKEVIQGGGDTEVLRVKGRRKLGRSRDCELMALTWLLARNRTMYMPSVVRVLRVLMMTPEDEQPLSCSLSRDGLPLAANYVQVDDTTSATTAAAASLPLIPPRRLLSLWGWSSLLLLLHL